MASIRKRQWFTHKQRNKIDPVAKQLAHAAGKPDAWKEFIREAAARLEIEPQETWLVAYVDQGKARRFKAFATKTEAKAWSVKALHEVSQGVHTAGSASKTVAEAWELWLDDCKSNNLELSTIRQRRQHLTFHVAPFLGAVKLSALSMPMVYDFDRALRDNGRSFAMRRAVLTNLKTMLGCAQKHNEVAQNVARGVKIKKDGREAPPPLRAGVDFPSKAELKALMDAAPERWRPFLITAIFTGMRASELRGLTWADVDLDAGMIHVRRRADAWKNMGAPKSKAGKRDIPLAPLVVNTLRQWHPVCPKGELGLVFPNGAGNIELAPNIFKRFWKPLQIKCGLTVDTGRKDAEGNPVLIHRYGFHMLRHAAASLFIAYLGWTPKRVQTVMGHSSINMTFDRYGHMFEDKESDRADMAKIEAAITAA